LFQMHNSFSMKSTARELRNISLFTLASIMILLTK
jgi:hypothetical protein